MIWHVSPLREYRGHAPLKNICGRAPSPPLHCAQTPSRNAPPFFFCLFAFRFGSNISLRIEESRIEKKEEGIDEM